MHTPPRPLTETEKDVHLYIAGKSLDISYIKTILDAHVDVNRSSQYSKKPLLHRAFFSENIDLILYLQTTAKANSLCADFKGNNLLFSCKSYWTIKKILEETEIDINAINNNGNTRLHEEIIKNPDNYSNNNIVNILLEKKANPFLVNAAGDSSLDLAMRSSRPLLKLILNTLPPQILAPIIRDKKHWRNIFIASPYNEFKLGVFLKKLKIFLKYINSSYDLEPDHFIQQLLPIAIAMNTSKGVLFLEEKGADLTAVDTATGATAIDLMLQNPTMHLMLMKKAMETADILLVKRLIHHKADLNEPVNKEKRMTMLHMAAKNNMPQIAQSLLMAGADIHAKAFYSKWNHIHDKTPFDIALLLGHSEIVEAMIAYTDINAKLSGGQAPLHIFDQNTPDHITKILLRHNANPEITNGEHLTPLMKAVRLGNPAIVKALLEGGANVNAFSPVSLNTSLHEAVLSPYMDRTEVISLLIDSKADVTWKNLAEDPPLDMMKAAKGKKFYIYLDKIARILESAKPSGLGRTEPIAHTII